MTGEPPQDAAHFSHPGLTFPERMDIKVMGHHNPRFEALMHGLILRHVPADRLHAVHARPSSAGKYLALTFTLTVNSYEELSAIYHDLSRSDEVLYAI